MAPLILSLPKGVPRKPLKGRRLVGRIVAPLASAKPPAEQGWRRVSRPNGEACDGESSHGFAGMNRGSTKKGMGVPLPADSRFWVCAGFSDAWPSGGG